MKINFPILEEALDIEGVHILVLKQKKLFAETIKWLYQYGNEESKLRLFDKDYKPFKPTELMIVTDILGFDINSAPVLKLIYEDLEQALNSKPEVKSQLERLAADITQILSCEFLENELDLEYDEITILELIKALGVKIETQSDSIFEKSFEIIQVFKYLVRKKLLIFINIATYLEEKEIASLIEYAKLNRINALFIEPSEVYNFPCYEIDEDYFVLVKK
ncbi:type II-A CRISPR-associated protein Csn2 [Aerococcaceae bacterium NML190073]|nr:type II-A CRISPR-associated protein Csn2 [Aerococcaceae bacterium NML190073]